VDEGIMIILILDSVLWLITPVSSLAGKLLKTISSTPILGLSFDKSSNRTEIAFVPEKVGLLFAVRPEVDSVG